MENRLQMDAKTLVKTLICFAVILFFWVAPPIAPITQAGMRTIGVFIGTILLLSIVDTVWPAIFSFALLSQTGVLNLNAVLAGSLGSWIIMFVIMSFVLTHALNEVGFTSRLTAYYMSRKFVSKSPWTFTFAFMALGGIVAMFMDQVPAAAFFLGFANRIIKELGYDKKDRYPQMLTMGVVFAVNIFGASTPISHSLALLGMGIYESATGKSISMFTYMSYGVPLAIILYILLCVLLWIFYKPDLSKFKTFDVNRVLDKLQPMGTKEKITVFVFFATVFLWVLPGIIAIFAPQAPILAFLNGFGITFWALIAVVVLSILQIDKKPIINLKEVWSQGFAWGVIFFIAIGVLLGSAVSNEKVGLNNFITENLVPITSTMPPILIVFILAFATTLMTNFASNVTTITVMTGVGVAIALSTGINPMAVALTTTISGSLAYMVPSSFATIAMLHADEYSKGSTIIKYGFVCVIISSVVTTFIGYPLACLLG
jgi:anion transporter